MSAEALATRIWLSQKSRIEAEKRLRLLDLLSQLALISSSLSLVIASYFSIREGSAALSEVVHVLSIIVLVIGVFLSSRQFALRSVHMRSCYEELGRLYASVSNENCPDVELSEAERRYAEVLKYSENHLTIDYYLALIKLKWGGEKITKKVSCTMYIYVMSRWLWSTVLFGAVVLGPALLFFILRDVS